jgi:hypothetical protein
MDARFFTFTLSRRNITFEVIGESETMSFKSKLRGPFARVAVNLVIGIVGLVIVRLIAQYLPMFQDAGWIVEDKMTVQAGALIVIDVLMLSVLVRFAIELRAYLVGRFAEIPGLGTMAATLVFLVAAAIAYIDFKPVTSAWPAIAQFYLWGFFALAAILLIQIVVLLYRDRDSISARILDQPVPAVPSDQRPSAGVATSAVAGR